MLHQSIYWLLALLRLLDLFVFLYQLVLDWPLARQHNRPNNQDSQPYSDYNSASNHQSISLRVSRIVINYRIFDFQKLESSLNIHFLAFIWNTDASKGLHASGSIFKADEEVMIRISKAGFVFTLVHLSRVISCNAGIHNCGKGESSIVLIKDALAESFDIFLTGRIGGLCGGKQSQDKDD